MYEFRKGESGYDILGAPEGLGRMGPQRPRKGYRRTGTEYRGPPKGRAAWAKAYDTSIAQTYIQHSISNKYAGKTSPVLRGRARKAARA